MPRRLLFDCEGDGLLDTVTKVHCIAAADVDTRERFDWKPDEIGQALEVMSTADTLIAHYGLGYDFPMLDKVRAFKVPLVKQRDTMVLGRLIRADVKDTDAELVKAQKLPSTLYGKHSIEAWGYRLGRPKLHTDIEDWSEWTPQIHERCIGDLDTNLLLWDYLKPDSYSQPAIELEHRIERICQMMRESGWPFDEKRAAEFHQELLAKIEPIEKQLKAEFGSWLTTKTAKKTQATKLIPLAQAFGLDPKDLKGEVYEWFTPKKPDAKRGYTGEHVEPELNDPLPAFGAKVLKPKRTFIGYPCTQLEVETFNPSSRQHIIRCLMRLGWKPVAYTDSGQPKLDDEVLEQLAEQFPQGGALVEYLLLDKRIGQLATGDKAWLKQVGSDGRMHGSINPMGTTTSRAAHYAPNLGQVPATKSPYGKECRELFTAPPGMVMVGADAAGLQLRCLGHYLWKFDGGAYGTAVASGDPHWRAVQAIGLSNEARDKHNGLHEVLREMGGKRSTYATVFGCFDDKFGSIIRDACTTARTKNPEWGHVYERFFGKGQTNRQVGGVLRPQFYEKLGLRPLLDKLARIRKDRQNPFPGSIPGLDARWVPCRSDHSSLAALLQCAEAVLCKRWVCDTYDALIAAGYVWGKDFVFLGWVHDELQMGVKKGLEQDIGHIVVECARNAGSAYGFRVPLASEYKVGRSWADTH